MERIPFTPQGYEALSRELQNLKTVQRPENIRAIEEARAHGDLSENAEYHAAKERQGFIEGRINELGYKLGVAEVIDITNISKEQALFGCRVLLENIDTGEETEYMLVGPEESDIDEGKISITSPIGKAILGKRAGDEVSVQTPGGKRNYELVEIL